MALPNRLGIFSWFGYCMPIQERARLIQQAGFAATSLWWEDEIGYEGGEKDALPAIVRKAGLYLENIHAPCMDCNSLWSGHADTRQCAVKRHIAWLTDCAYHDIPMMVMHVTDQGQQPVFQPQGLDSLLRIVEAGTRLGVKVAIENVWATPVVGELLNKIDSSQFGLCFDTSHDWLFSREKFALLQQYKDRLFALHLSDTNGQDDCHWLPGQGVVQWGDVLGSLPAQYQGYFTLEAYPSVEQRSLTPEQYLHKAYKQVEWVQSSYEIEQQQAV